MGLPVAESATGSPMRVCGFKPGSVSFGIRRACREKHGAEGAPTHEAMYTAKITFRRPPLEDSEEFVNAVYSQLAGWHQSGQALGDPVLAMTGDVVEVYVMVATPSALNAERDNRYAAEYREAFAAESIVVEILGVVPQAPSSCSCVLPSGYALYLPIGSRDLPPVCCTDCWERVPLFRFPAPDGHSHYHLQNWQKNYLACEQVWLSSGYGERLTARQLARHDSALSREGRQLCREYEATVGAPFYYALLAREEPDSATELTRRCPGCGGDWRLPELLHEFEFRCDDCRLLSELSPEVAREEKSDRG